MMTTKALTTINNKTLRINDRRRVCLQSVLRIYSPQWLHFDLKTPHTVIHHSPMETSKANENKLNEIVTIVCAFRFFVKRNAGNSKLCTQPHTHTNSNQLASRCVQQILIYICFAIHSTIVRLGILLCCDYHCVRNGPFEWKSKLKNRLWKSVWNNSSNRCEFHLWCCVAVQFNFDWNSFRAKHQSTAKKVQKEKRKKQN